MNISIDKNILDSFNSNDIFVYFYKSGCEWTKINFLEDFDRSELKFLKVWEKIIYYKDSDEEKLDWWKIVLKTNENNQWHENNDKYLFISPKVKSRCSCATSFSFENKLIDSNKLKKLKKIFKQK